MKKQLYTLIGLLLATGAITYGATILFPYQGGTGLGSATAGDVGKYLKVSDDSPFTYTFDTPTAGSGDPFPFTVTSYGVSTSTLVGFTAGIMATASSTIGNGTSAGGLTINGTATTTDLIITNITSALVLTNGSGVVAEYTGSTNPCTNQLPTTLTALGVLGGCTSVSNAMLSNSTISGVALGSNLFALTNDTTLSGSSFNGSSAISDWGIDLSNNNIWTSALTTFVNGVTIGNATTTNATTTNLSVSGTLDVDNLTSAITLTGAGGDFAEYTGASCTNQFVRSLSALGVATCATVGATDVSLANLTATDATLTFSGTYTGATARTIGLNLANPNTWTGLQQFSNATSTQFSAGTGNVFYVDSNGRIQGKDTTNAWSGVMSPTKLIPLQQGTSTAFTGTTTGAYMGQFHIPYSGTARSAICNTDGTYTTDWQISGAINAFIKTASSTNNKVVLNQSFSAGMVYYVAGNPSNSLATSTSCTLSITETY